jgi:hypothetical protein
MSTDAGTVRPQALSPAATARSRNPKHWSTADKTIRFRGAALWLEIEIGATEGAPELGMSTESDNDRPGANIMVRNVFRNAFRAGSSTSTRMIESSVTTTEVAGLRSHHCLTRSRCAPGAQ